MMTRLSTSRDVSDVRPVGADAPVFEMPVPGKRPSTEAPRGSKIPTDPKQRKFGRDLNNAALRGANGETGRVTVDATVENEAAFVRHIKDLDATNIAAAGGMVSFSVPMNRLEDVHATPALRFARTPRTFSSPDVRLRTTAAETASSTPMPQAAAMPRWGWVALGSAALYYVLNRHARKS
jgi:hypothetical protein